MRARPVPSSPAPGAHGVDFGAGEERQPLGNEARGNQTTVCIATRRHVALQPQPAVCARVRRRQRQPQSVAVVSVVAKPCEPPDLLAATLIEHAQAHRRTDRIAIRGKAGEVEAERLRDSPQAPALAVPFEFQRSVRHGKATGNDAIPPEALQQVQLEAHLVQFAECQTKAVRRKARVDTVPSAFEPMCLGAHALQKDIEFRLECRQEVHGGAAGNLRQRQQHRSRDGDGASGPLHDAV